MMTLSDRFFGKRAIVFGRATIGTSILNVSELNQNVDLGAVLATASALDISSSNAADAAAGTGARTIEIAGLDFAGNPLTETIALNGLTVVTTTKAFWRVFGAQAVTFGTGRKNAGDIYILKAGTGGAYAAGVPPTLTSALIKILVNENLGVSGLFTAPRGCQYRITSWRQGSRVQVGKHMIFIASERTNPAMPPTMMIGNDLPVAAATSVPAADEIFLNQLEDIYFKSLMGAASGVVTVNAVLEKV